MSAEHSTLVPRLLTERFTLRAYRREDFDLFADHLMDPESSLHLGSCDRQAAWRLFTSQTGLWLIHGAGWWAIEHSRTGQLVGNVGAFFREGSTVMEMGWNTYRAFWGQGIAYEAAAAVLKHAFDVRGEPKVQALIAAGNDASRRVAERLGMQYATETALYGKPVGCYTLER
ncbi:GNAT family N-acetyltransferase [Pseudoduganella umbonata]|uniref:GNAT family N-acetyltransferase n=1 Tax=Pseudoduganella umbonata TaxID=864828 RepID=A0A4V1EDC8_9BURK|nr:GNAT family N-acetyltransferase [Pseudoduganella umbonata]MBB3221480.1 RimJ/RimL family protein N-acetyltransferase [Pseudoduganella umbonata]QCP10631.1 GNAT family N-acetyltransferase [Pseudoduganella umbonata]